MKRIFNPWVGANYQTGGAIGIRILILGESHYGTRGRESSDTTPKLIRRLGQDCRFAFYTKVQKLIQNRTDYVTDDERRSFWDDVAFYNFIQRFPGDGPRIRPTEKMWAHAPDAYLQTVRELKPELIIIMGRELQSHVPYIETKMQSDNFPRICEIDHPSYPKIDLNRARRIIRKSILSFNKKGA